MSYQTSIHFDPTALLIIKNEVDNSIKIVVSPVTTFVEAQSLHFAIGDALNLPLQCPQVIALIEMYTLATLANYPAPHMLQTIATPVQVTTQDVLAPSE